MLFWGVDSKKERTNDWFDLVQISTETINPGYVQRSVTLCSIICSENKNGSYNYEALPPSISPVWFTIVHCLQEDILLQCTVPNQASEVLKGMVNGIDLSNILAKRYLWSLPMMAFNRDHGIGTLYWILEVRSI